VLRSTATVVCRSKTLSSIRFSMYFVEAMMFHDQGPSAPRTKIHHSVAYRFTVDSKRCFISRTGGVIQASDVSML